MTLHPKVIKRLISHLSIGPGRRGLVTERYRISLVVNGAKRMFLLRNIKTIRAALTSPPKLGRRTTLMCK